MQHLLSELFSLSTYLAAVESLSTPPVLLRTKGSLWGHLAYSHLEDCALRCRYIFVHRCIAAASECLVYT
jgi:hypothetical protein